jgi:hypothetical protein
MVTEEISEELFNPVTKEELISVLQNFKKDKSPGPDGWSVEFYIEFFDLLGMDLLWVVEEVRTSRRMEGGLNATFLALIPKKDYPESFDGFRPISLCNCLYKIIAKVIATRLKPILSEYVSAEQFGFFKGKTDS